MQIHQTYDGGTGSKNIQQSADWLRLVECIFQGIPSLTLQFYVKILTGTPNILYPLAIGAHMLAMSVNSAVIFSEDQPGMQTVRPSQLPWLPPSYVSAAVFYISAVVQMRSCPGCRQTISGSVLHQCRMQQLQTNPICAHAAPRKIAISCHVLGQIAMRTVAIVWIAVDQAERSFPVVLGYVLIALICSLYLFRSCGYTISSLFCLPLTFIAWDTTRTQVRSTSSVCRTSKWDWQRMAEAELDQALYMFCNRCSCFCIDRTSCQR